MRCAAPVRQRQSDAPLGLDLVGLRLQVASRLFNYFSRVRRRLGLDSDSQQILFSFMLTGLAEASRVCGSQATFAPEDFCARLNASTIADMTGIPRETVRRKLIKLGAEGFLINEGLGVYVMDRYWSDLDIVEALAWILR